jgi:hypothetical protein
MTDIHDRRAQRVQAGDCAMTRRDPLSIQAQGAHTVKTTSIEFSTEDDED